MRILLLNGPNLNLLGQRETELYGSDTLASIVTNMERRAKEQNIELTHLQSHREYELIDAIHQASINNVDFILFNPAAFTHTSVALRDALLAVHIPFIEIHLSNIYAREPFRQHSYFSDKAVGTISGLGAHGYQLALDAAVHYLQTK